MMRTPPTLYFRNPLKFKDLEARNAASVSPFRVDSVGAKSSASADCPLVNTGMSLKQRPTNSRAASTCGSDLRNVRRQTAVAISPNRVLSFQKAERSPPEETVENSAGCSSVVLIRTPHFAENSSPEEDERTEADFKSVNNSSTVKSVISDFPVSSRVWRDQIFRTEATVGSMKSEDAVGRESSSNSPLPLGGRSTPPISNRENNGSSLVSGATSQRPHILEARILPGNRLEFVSSDVSSKFSIVERRPSLEWLLGRMESTGTGSTAGALHASRRIGSPHSAPIRPMSSRAKDEDDANHFVAHTRGTGTPQSASVRNSETFYYTSEVAKRFGTKNFSRARSRTIGGISEAMSSEEKLPPLIAKSPRLTRAYKVNREFKSLIVKSIINVYLFTMAYKLWRTCIPWYTYFKYLTCWGWTVVQMYFLYTLYLDIRARVAGGAHHLSVVALTTAQALSELACAVQVVVVMFFWIVVFPQQPYRSVFWEVNMHGMGLVLMLFDYIYRFTGFSMRNHRYILQFAAFYSVLHISVVLSTGEEIYPGVNFKTFFSFTIFLAGLSTVVFVHKLVYLVHNWRQITDDAKCTLGVLAFFLLPRQDSLEFYVVSDEDQNSESEDSVGGQNRSLVQLRRSRTIEFPHLGRRLSEFVNKELLSLSPAEQETARQE